MSDRLQTDKLTDEQLVERYRESGDAALLGMLYKRYAHLVLGLCIKYLKNQEDAQDMVMHIFEKLHKDLRTKEVQLFKAWLYTVSKNECLMELRKRKRVREKHDNFEKDQQQLVENDLLPHLDIGINGIAGSDHEAQLEQLEVALTHLNEPQKACIELFYLKRHSYSEVAEKTGFTLKQVKSYLQNGRRNLRNILENGQPGS